VGSPKATIWAAPIGDSSGSKSVSLAEKSSVVIGTAWAAAHFAKGSSPQAAIAEYIKRIVLSPPRAAVDRYLRFMRCPTKSSVLDQSRPLINQILPESGMCASKA
jgi:hypothetical protein